MTGLKVFLGGAVAATVGYVSGIIVQQYLDNKALETYSKLQAEKFAEAKKELEKALDELEAN